MGFDKMDQRKPFKGITTDLSPSKGVTKNKLTPLSFKEIGLAGCAFISLMLTRVKIAQKSPRHIVWTHRMIDPISL